MASTRELWILLKARDEASRVVTSFSKNVRAAALSAQAAQRSAEAAAIRQRAQMLKTNGATAQQIRSMNDQVRGLERQARAQTAAAARAREFRAEQLRSIEGQVRANNRHAANLERQARAFTLAANMGEEHRSTLIRLNGATEESTRQIDNNIAAARRRAATLNAEAAVARGASASMVARLQEEQTGIDGSIRSYERRAAVLRAQAAQIRNNASTMNAALQNQVRDLDNQAAALDRQANAFRRAAGAARQHDIRMKKLREGLSKVSEASTVAAFAIGSVGVGGLVGLKSSIETAVEYERQVRHTMTQTGEFATTLEELGAVGKRIANEIGVSFQTIQPGLFEIFSSMDVNVKDAEKLLRSFSMAAVAGQTDIQNVSKATIGLLNAFHRPAKDVNKILDVQFQLVKLGIGTYEEWNQRIGLVTPSAVRAGQSIETMAAALATSTRMGISAARSATAVSRAMDALSHPKAIQAMEKLGIKVRDARGNMLPMNQTLRQFRNILMKMPKKDRVETILNVFKSAGGTIEARRFLQNILLGKNNLELFDSILKRVSKSSGSMEENYKLMADTTATKTELMKNKWQLLKEAIGKALLPTFNSLLDTVGKVMTWFNKLPDSTKNTIAQFLLWGSIIALVVGGMFAFIAVAAIVASALATVGLAGAVAIGIIAAIPLVIAAVGIAFIEAYKHSETFREYVNKVIDTLKEFWNIAKDTATKIKESFEKHILPPVEKIWGIIQEKFIPAFKDAQDMINSEFIPKIKEAGRIIADLADTAFKKIGEVIDGTIAPALSKLGDWWDKNGEKLTPLISLLGQAAKWFAIIAAVVIGVLVVAMGSILGGIILLVIGLFQGIIMIVAKVVDKFREVKEVFSAAGSVISDWASKAGEWFAQLWEKIKQWFSDVGQWFSELPGKIGEFLSGLPDKISSAFQTAFAKAGEAVGSGLGELYNAFETFFTEIVPNIGQWLYELPDKLGKWFSDAWDSAKTSISNGAAAALIWFIQFPGKASTAISNLWSSIKTHFHNAKEGAKKAAKDLVDGFMKWLNELPGKISTACSKAYHAVIDAFKGAGTWLYEAGKDIVNGLINGLTSMFGGAKRLLGNFGAGLVKGFKDSTGVKSPSVKFKKIGFYLIQGLINGITGTRKALKNALSKLSHEVLSALDANGASKSTKEAWKKKLTNTTKKLLDLETKRAAVHKKLVDAEKSLKEQVKARADLAGKITEKLSEGANITNLEGRTPAQVKKSMAKKLQDLQQFSQNLAILQAKGLNKESIADLAQAGVDQAGSITKALAESSSADIQEINAMQDQIKKIAGQTGNSIAGQMYDAGIKAAEGLVKGLKDKEAAITKQMEKIAKALIKSIKKSLGIKSPSKVFEQIGVNTALGYMQGYKKQMVRSSLHGEMLAYSTRPTFAPVPTMSDNNFGRTFNQEINVYTNEIDPRRHAAELGFELEGRLR